MANTKISALPSASTLGGTEVLSGVQSAATVGITANQLKTWASSSPTLVTPTAGSMTITGGIATPFTLGNGTWAGFAVPYVRPQNAGGLAFDVMTYLIPGDVWVDICSSDIVADSTNYETLKLFKGNAADAYITTTKGGTGTVRNLSLQTTGGRLILPDGSGVTPLVTGSASNSGFVFPSSGNDFAWVRAGSMFAAIAFSRVVLESGSRFSWSSSGGDPFGTEDLAMTRVGAGIMKVSDNSTGPGVVVTQATTVASLPAAATAGAGARCFVTNATATTFLSTVAGGGSNKVPVVSDGTNWVIG